MLSQATYIWMDGTKPTQKLRSKTRIIPIAEDKPVSIEAFPEWGYDGSSTYQAEGHFSDLILKPVNFVDNPLANPGDFLVMCEVFNPDGTPHESNTRAALRELMQGKAKDEDFWIGYEQEYTLFKGYRPIGWPERGFPAPQGPFYCGVGADEAFGRELVDDHTQACLDAGIMIFGTNAEVMPGQWEFQIGYRGVEGESADPLNVADHVWLARWLLYRMGEEYNVIAKLDPKPMSGDWNGAGQHTNISNKAMRDPATGEQTIERAIKALEQKHMTHIKEYGADLDRRLTGLHETAPIDQFSAGVSDRGASIRIPPSVKEKGCGYIEDRRPGANADPYRIARALVETIVES